MKIIPVLDLKNTVVVHAKQGNREHYQPIQSNLCRSSDIFHVIDAFLGLYDFKTFYIADLNAIIGQGHHEALLSQVFAAYPDKAFWLDAGYRQYPGQVAYADNFWPVVGSESYREDALCGLEQLDKRFILSLDYSAQGILGAASLFANAGLWPETVIIMTLTRVGSNLGPDFAKLASFVREYPQINFVAAGGIRGIADLLALQQLGIKEALVASCLHSGALAREDIEKLAN
jgi:phosphoribosylformimino-5-aminoimidazole carboxamide ribotide isomerase